MDRTYAQGCRACRERVARLRGLCDRCYSRLSKLVRRKLATWAQLEREGKALPAAKEARSRWSSGNY